MVEYILRFNSIVLLFPIPTRREFLFLFVLFLFSFSFPGAQQTIKLIIVWGGEDYSNSKI